MSGRITGASGIQTVIPGQSVELIRYCLPSDINPRVISGKITADLVNAAQAVNAYNRDLKAVVNFQGEKGGGTVELDCARGTCFSIPADTVGITIRNDSAVPIAPDADDTNTYQVEASMANHPEKYECPVFTQREVIGAVAQTAWIRVPSYARWLQIHTNVDTPGVAPFSRVEFIQNLIAAVPPVLYGVNINTGQTVSAPRIPVISGAEYVRVTNPDTVARTYIFVWCINL